MVVEEFVGLAGVAGAVTRYYNSAALQQGAEAVALITLSLCMAVAVVGLLWKWRRERKG